MQKQDKQIKDIDMLSLPPRSDRISIRESDELPTRSELIEEKKRTEKKIRSRYRLAKILLCLFIPIPLGFIVYTYNPEFFAIFSRETTSAGSSFETVHIARARDEDGTQKDEQQSDLDSSEEESATEDNTDKYIYHTVKEGDTLYSISIEYFGNRDGEKIIREANDLSSGELELGQQIKIPKEYLE